MQHKSCSQIYFARKDKRGMVILNNTCPFSNECTQSAAT